MRTQRLFPNRHRVFSTNWKFKEHGYQWFTHLMKVINHLRPIVGIRGNNEFVDIEDSDVFVFIYISIKTVVISERFLRPGLNQRFYFTVTLIKWFYVRLFSRKCSLIHFDKTLQNMKRKKLLEFKTVIIFVLTIFSSLIVIENPFHIFVNRKRMKGYFTDA